MKKIYTSPEFEFITVIPSDVIMSTIGEGGGQIFDGGEGEGGFGEE